jgi:ATP-dependent Clp protease ATP-binding subunit ClpC
MPGLYESAYPKPRSFPPPVVPGRFTDRARTVMHFANHEARRLNHEYVGTEHILLGLVAEGRGVGAVAVKNLGVSLGTVRAEVERIVIRGADGDLVTVGRLSHTPKAKKVLEYAAEEAQTLNHHFVGTEHLLLGLLRESECLAAVILTNLGLKLEAVREEVLNLLGHNPLLGPQH